MSAKKWENLADFINHATEEEKREVYEIAMERAVARQRAAIFKGPCEKCVTHEYCNREKWCYLGSTCYRDSVNPKLPPQEKP